MIKRSARSKNFTVLGNAMFSDNGLSFEAMGLLAYLLSKPDNWSVSPHALVKATEGTDQKRGKNKIYALLKVLVDAGYVERQKRSTGEVDYTVYDEPVTPNREQAGEPNPPNPEQAQPDQENPDQDSRDVLIRTERQQELNIKKERKGNKAQARRATKSVRPEPPEKPQSQLTRREQEILWLGEHGVAAKHAEGWLEVRKAKRAGALTQVVIDGLLREAGKAGIPADDAVRICAERGWQGFNASWNWRDDVSRPGGATGHAAIDRQEAERKAYIDALVARHEQKNRTIDGGAR